MRRCAGYIFIVSGTTKTQINHDNKVAVVHWHNPESAMITWSDGKATRSGQKEATSYQKLVPWIWKKPQQIIAQYQPEGPTKISRLDWEQAVQLTHRDCSGFNSFSETNLLKTLASKTKIAGLIIWALSRYCTPKLQNLIYESTGKYYEIKDVPGQPAYLCSWTLNTQERKEWFGFC